MARHGRRPDDPDIPWDAEGIQDDNTTKTPLSRAQKIVRIAKQARTLPRLLRLLRIERCDYVVVGDGSGTTWDQPCGFAAVMIENGTFQAEVYDGAFHRGTNVVSEMMALLYPLIHLAARTDRRRQPDGSTIIHLVTDCEHVKLAGSGKIGRGKKNRMLWSLFDYFQRCGFVLHWHWIPRDTVPIQKVTHYAANAVRKMMIATAVKRREMTYAAVKIGGLEELIVEDPGESLAKKTKRNIA